MPGNILNIRDIAVSIEKGLHFIFCMRVYRGTEYSFINCVS